jgi:hypothetical protein
MILSSRIPRVMMLLAISAVVHASEQKETAGKNVAKSPSFVIFLADDLGWGDLMSILSPPSYTVGSFAAFQADMPPTMFETFS